MKRALEPKQYIKKDFVSNLNRKKGIPTHLTDTFACCQSRVQAASKAKPGLMPSYIEANSSSFTVDKTVKWSTSLKLSTPDAIDIKEAQRGPKVSFKHICKTAACLPIS